VVSGTCRRRHGASIVLTSALEYDLPRELVATRPASPRDAARLLVYRKSDASIMHVHVRDLPGLLERGDLLVRNDTAVLHARLQGQRGLDAHGRGGGRVDGLYVETIEEGLWLVMLTAGGRLREGECIALGPGLSLELVRKQDRHWVARPSCAASAADMLDGAGYTPLPPYILKARNERGEVVDDADDRQWYRTLFADNAHRGSVAAPTAGLHLTQEVDNALTQRGVDVAHVTLHVGEGTFRGIETDTLEAHAMHSERFSVDSTTVAQLQQPRQGRLIAVGTTTTRLLESLPRSLPAAGISESTDLLIAPGHQWRWVNGLLTNFHLPRSTLLALVGAMVGMDNLRTIYAEALEQRYRFYSYGDAMLILP